MFLPLLVVSFSLSTPLANAFVVPNCTNFQWRCSDGACIEEDLKCNGKVDCADGSDETFVTCRENRCISGEYKCLYGGCINQSKTCDGVKDCLDNSDEVLRQCRHEPDFFDCLDSIHGEIQSSLSKIQKPEDFGSYKPPNASYLDCFEMDVKCKNGDKPRRMTKCNGKVECRDGSDETMEECASRACDGGNFRCAYGGCIGSNLMCNGVNDCVDGSDELEDLCVKKPSKNSCILPQFPKNGYYAVLDSDRGYPGLALDTAHLNYSCHLGFKLIGTPSPYCINGFWSDSKQPQCVSQCLLNKHPSVEYLCLPSGNSLEDAKECGELVEDGTTVRPQCRTPNYYDSGVLVNMHCVDGVWDHVAICSPQCGLVTSEGEQLVVGGRTAKRGELPWHAGIYKKTTTPYMQICGGSLVSTNIVISAAHCFWSDVEKQLPASNFAVAVGKLYRPWNNTRDVDAQKSDVREIKMPPRFQGAAANFQEDIALVFTTTSFEFKTYVRPVCIDFDYNFERRQLVIGAKGKVAGWGLTSEDGPEARVLQVVELPYAEIEECIRTSPPGFREYITSDKICAGYNNGTSVALCKGDSGGGLTFVARERGAERYFLRGVVSTAPVSDHLCNVHVYTTFTQITKHDAFIRLYL